MRHAAKIKKPYQPTGLIRFFSSNCTMITQYCLYLRYGFAALFVLLFIRLLLKLRLVLE